MSRGKLRAGRPVTKRYVERLADDDKHRPWDEGSGPMMFYGTLPTVKSRCSFQPFRRHELVDIHMKGSRDPARDYEGAGEGEDDVLHLLTPEVKVK